MSASQPINILIWLIVFVIVVVVIIVLLKFLFGVLFIAPSIEIPYSSYILIGSDPILS